MNIRAFILVFIFAFSNVSYSATNSCEDIFAPSGIRDRVRIYTKEFRELKPLGLRLFFKKPVEEVGYTANGFFRENEPSQYLGYSGFFRKLIQYVPTQISKWVFRKPGYRWTPAHGFHQNIFNRPSLYVTRNRGDGALIPSLVTTLLLSAAVTTPPYIYVDARAEQTVTLYDTQIARLLHDDYRFYSFKQAYENKRISFETAMERTRTLYGLFEDYYAYYYTVKPEYDLDADIESVSTNVLFVELSDLFERGNYPKPGFRIAPGSEGPLTQEQKREIMFLLHTVYLKDAIISDLLARPESLARFKADPNMLQIINSIVENPYRLELESLFHAGKITLGQYHFRLQEDAYMEFQFLMYDRLGVTPLDSNGNPYTLNDVRNQILSDLVAAD